MTAAPALDFLLPGDPHTLTGGYAYDRRIVQGLRALGWQVKLRSLDASFPRPTVSALEQAGAALAGIPAGRIVVIDGLALGAMPELLAAHAQRLRLVALIHHPLAAERGLSDTLRAALHRSEQHALSTVRRTLVTSRWTQRQLAGYGVDAGRIGVIEPGTDPAPLARGSRGTSLVLLCVATLTPRKGHAVLVEALAQLRDRRWHLNCAGSLKRDPRTADALREQIIRSGLAQRIALLGEVTPGALAALYDRADLFVLASYLEGYGMVVAEAVSRGLPLVCTAAGALPETAAAGAALVVPAGDSAALAGALAKLMDDPRALRELATASRRARPSLRTWEQACAQFAAQLKALT